MTTVFLEFFKNILMNQTFLFSVKDFAIMRENSATGKVWSFKRLPDARSKVTLKCLNVFLHNDDKICWIDSWVHSIENVILLSVLNTNIVYKIVYSYLFWIKYSQSINGDQKLCEAGGLKLVIKTETLNFQKENIFTSKYKHAIGALVIERNALRLILSL